MQDQPRGHQLVLLGGKGAGQQLAVDADRGFEAALVYVDIDLCKAGTDGKCARPSARRALIVCPNIKPHQETLGKPRTDMPTRGTKTFVRASSKPIYHKPFHTPKYKELGMQL